MSPAPAAPTATATAYVTVLPPLALYPNAGIGYNPYTGRVSANGLWNDVIQIVNGTGSPWSGIALNFPLPTGLKLALASTNTCGMTNMAVGSTSVSMTGGALAAGASCQVTLPASSPTAGNFSVTVPANALTVASPAYSLASVVGPVSNPFEAMSPLSKVGDGFAYTTSNPNPEIGRAHV